jgi:putative redox protein
MEEKKNIVKEYTDGTIRVIWKPALCWHAAECIKGLPEVFNVNARPWVNMAAATPDAIAAVVDRCPSGALTWEKAV